MDNERSKGAVTKVKSSVKAVIGKVMGVAKLQAKGRAAYVACTRRPSSAAPTTRPGGSGPEAHDLTTGAG
ncbi:hypothetical protein [Cypionkella sp.]|uniref:hypothetical protein n=1 Tax=Cypionkella sp. TaxID=2811411 RepID=UPI0026385C2F|nr:hypothetical protein [Cypionkella sp.]MDB5667038.1 hypothetical protein [Cypionkella sp.]